MSTVHIRYVNNNDETDILNETSLRKKYFMISFSAKPISQATLDFFKIPYTRQEVEVPEPEVSLEQLKADAVNKVQSNSNTLIAQLEEGYTDGEIKSFEQQNQGAIDILAGNTETENATFVISLLKERLNSDQVPEESIIEFANRIRSNYLKARAASIKIVGRQQNIELQIREAETKEALEAIDLNIELPVVE